MEAITQVFLDNESFKEPWQRYEATSIIRLTHDGADSFWAAESAADAFDEHSLFDEGINKQFYQAVPGLATSVGLFFTFLAILVALMEVRSDGIKVAGLSGLINGLSGKFLTSVAALLAASIYLLAEKPVWHRLTLAHRSLIDAIDRSVPRLTPTRLLANLDRQMTEQTNAFHSFNTSLAIKLQESFSTSIGPTLERMVESIEGLNQFLKQAELARQETTTGEIKRLLTDVEQSMSATLASMGKQFSDSLSGDVRGQFNGIIESLDKSASVIDKMNSQLEGTQEAMKAIAQLAKESTLEQISQGRKQSQDVAEVLTALMTQMKEATGVSANNMLSAMAVATESLAQKVDYISDRMSQLIQESTGQVNKTATEVIEKSDQVSEANMRRLTALLERLDNHADQTARLKLLLDEAMGNLTKVLVQYAEISKDIFGATSNFSLTANYLKGISSEVKDTQTSIREVSELSARQVDRLETAWKHVDVTTSAISNSMNDYQRVFDVVKGSSQSLLDTIATHMNQYSDTTRNHFDSLVSVANGHMTEAVGKLRNIIGELDESISDLSDALLKVPRR
ncbi:MAG: hypothetical protein V2A77_08105 [Pseudomonadota bacterium]